MARPPHRSVGLLARRRHAAGPCRALQLERIAFRVVKIDRRPFAFGAVARLHRAAGNAMGAEVRADGRIVERTAEFTQDVLVAEVPARSELTLATRVGAWPELLMSIIAILALVQALRTRRRSTND